MLRHLALFISLSAFAGIAAADCDVHSDKDAMAGSSKTLASSLPAVKATKAPSASKQAPACLGGNCDSVANPAPNVKTAQKTMPPSAKEAATVAN